MNRLTPRATVRTTTPPARSGPTREGGAMSQNADSADVLDVVIRRLKLFYGAAETAMELAYAARASGLQLAPDGEMVWRAPQTDEEKRNLENLQKIWSEARRTFRAEAAELMKLMAALGERLRQEPFNPQSVHYQLRLHVQNLHDRAMPYIFAVVNPCADCTRELYGVDWREKIEQAVEPLRQMHRLLIGMRGRTEREPLSSNARKVYEILIVLPEHEALTGPQILDRLESLGLIIDQSTLTKNILPELRQYGLKNKPRVGYYIPLSCRQI